SIQKRLLRNGFLPDHEDVIIAAGLQCLPLINSADLLSEPSESAVLRLRMIVTKLKLMRPSKQVSRAIKQFEAILQSKARAELRITIIAYIVVGAGALLLIVGAAAALYKFLLK